MPASLHVSLLCERSESNLPDKKKNPKKTPTNQQRRRVFNRGLVRDPITSVLTVSPLQCEAKQWLCASLTGRSFDRQSSIVYHQLCQSSVVYHQLYQSSVVYHQLCQSSVVYHQ